MANLFFEEARLTSDAIRYGFAAGKARALERRTLDAGTFERLLDAASFAEQKRLLSDSPYGRFLEDVQTPAEVEQALDDALSSAYRFMRDAELPRSVVEYFRVRYDYSNLKAAIKARLVGSTPQGMLTPHGLVPMEAFAGPLEALPEPYAPIAGDVLRRWEAEPETTPTGAPLEASALTEQPDLAAVDHAVDQAMFAHLARLAAESKSSFLQDVTVMAIDLANVKVLVRSRFANRDAEWMRGQLIDGGSVPHEAFVRIAGASPDDLVVALQRYPSLRGIPGALLSEAATLDVAVDAVTQSARQRAKRGPVGPEPVIAYVFGRESEVAALRALLLGTLSGVSRDVLRARLRPGL